MDPLRFNAERLKRKPPSGMDVETTLAHFAIVTYMVDPSGNIVSALRGVHSRQELRAALENLD